MNGDGEVDISDGIRLLLFLFGGAPGPGCIDAADADDSGKLEVTDAIFSFLYLFSGGPAPPVPGPSACGRDPTEDELGCATVPEGCP
ncbi:MAG: hypothetical protein HY721_20465 [Planctomycetes bacterium]|nr:hypothetical protein [Planctomycetota bacterium]